MINFLPSLRNAVYKKLHRRSVGAGAHINPLPRIKIPVGKKMYHGCFLCICPFCLKNITGILWKSRRVYLTEIAVFCMVRGGLSNIVKAAP